MKKYHDHGGQPPYNVFLEHNNSVDWAIPHEKKNQRI